MKVNPKKARFFIYYILSPLYVLLLFRIIFFDDSDSFLEKIISHQTDPKMYLALLLCIIGLILLLWGMKFTKNDLK
jgi:hypothetical protein